MRRICPLVLIAAACLAACNTDTDRGVGIRGWVGTITTDGAVTTVVNESGSVWGGAATLVEEASIGVESGADENMFGRISSIHATDDRIYVVDSQVPAVRVYDHDGGFIHTLGRSGQGPGEYRRPSLVTADAGGRVFVLDTSLARINVYSESGEILEPWPMPSSRCCVWPMHPLTGEAVWAPVQEWLDRERSGRRYGLQAIGPEGPYGDVTWIPDLEFVQATFQVEEGFETATPFAAWLVWNPAPYGGLVVGASDGYRFEVHDRDGSKLVVERTWEPVPVPAEHKEWERRRTIAAHRAMNNPELIWDGAGIPDHKSAYSSLIPAASGETWVTRPGSSVRFTDCAEDPIAEGHPAGYDRPCWSDQRSVDVFGDEGRYLGEVAVPDEVLGGASSTSIDGRRFVAVVQDDAGTYMVKRYRLVLPADDEQ